MHSVRLLQDIAVILAAAFPILFVARRLRLPEVFAFLVAGIVIGPHGLGWISQLEDIEAIAELGVALILFFVGLHFPPSRLRALGARSLVSGSLQVGLTILLTFLVLVSGGLDPKPAIFYGILVALGSTAVVLPILAWRDEMGAPYARHFLGVSLFQDFAVIPLVLLVPALAPSGIAPRAGIVVERILIAFCGIALLVILSRFAVPALFRQIRRVGSREAFTAAVAVLVIGMVAVAGRLGISPAIGAFAAGVVLGDTDFIHEVSGVLRPFRDVLSSLFFASVGMLLQPRFVMEHLPEVGLAILVVVGVKLVAGFPAFRAGGATKRAALRATLAITPVGEFSFLIAQAGQQSGVLREDSEQIFLSVAVLTLAAAPLLISFGRWVAERLHDVSEKEVERVPAMSDHILLVGYGLNGQNVAGVLAAIGIRYIVIDQDPDAVAAARAREAPVLLADGGDPEALAVAGVDRARGIVVAISDPDSVRRIVRQCRNVRDDLRVIVRTRYVSEVETLRRLGADEVIPEEFETSIEIVMRVLRLFHVPGNVVAAQLRILRDEEYRLLRDPERKALQARRYSAILAAGTHETFLVLPDSPVEGRALGDLEVEEDHVTVPLVIRDGKAISPQPELGLVAGDSLILVGAHADLMRTIARLEGRNGTQGAEE